jgi:hypothetical protein
MKILRYFTLAFVLLMALCSVLLLHTHMSHAEGRIFLLVTVVAVILDTIVAAKIAKKLEACPTRAQ